MYIRKHAYHFHMSFKRLIKIEFSKQIIFFIISAPPPPSHQALSTVDLSNKNGAQKMSDDSGSNSSSASGSPTKEIPSIGSTNFHRSKVSHSFSVPLNLFSIARSDQQANPAPVFDQPSMAAAK